MREKLTYANVTATIALFLALSGGVVWAAGKIGSNDIKNNAIRTRHIHNGAVTAAKLIKPSSVKSAGLPVNESNTCGAANDWESLFPSFGGPVGYYRDIDGIVHLTGVALECGSAPANIFKLRQGYRPAVRGEFVGLVSGTPTSLFVFPDGGVRPVTATSSGDNFELYSISFRCGPSGSNGCP